MKLLEISGLTARYNAGDVLHGLDVTVDEGEIVTLLGSNGAGKVHHVALHLRPGRAMPVRQHHAGWGRNSRDVGRKPSCALAFRTCPKGRQGVSRD